MRKNTVLNRANEFIYQIQMLEQSKKVSYVTEKPPLKLLNYMRDRDSSSDELGKESDWKYFTVQSNDSFQWKSTGCDLESNVILIWIKLSNGPRKELWPSEIVLNCNI